MKTGLIAALLVWVVACTGAHAASAQLIKCKMAFSLQTWSIFYTIDFPVRRICIREAYTGARD